MAKCEISGKRPQVKNLVSHSNIKTKSIALPNVQYKRLWSKTLGRMVRFYVATSALKSLEVKGGLDIYLLRQKDEVLSKRALTVKKQIQRTIRQAV